MLYIPDEGEISRLIKCTRSGSAHALPAQDRRACFVDPVFVRLQWYPCQGDLRHGSQATM